VRRAGRPRWPLRLFRTVATLYAVATIAQPFLAGMFLSGQFSALAMHETTATIVGLLGIVTIICSVLLWRIGGTSALPLRISTVLFALIALQIVFGYTKILALHVPLGVALVFGVVRLAVYGWREADR
jgi:hypothetical protein